MSAEVLRRAASLMRERANDASRGPWTKARGPHGEGVRASRGAIVAVTHGDNCREDMRHIASWHPAVALAVADWLDHAARQVQAVLDDARAYDEPTRDLTADFGPALAVARRYLGDP